MNSHFAHGASDFSISVYSVVLTGRYYVAVHLCSNFSQDMVLRKYELGYQLVCHFFLFLPHFDVICYQLQFIQMHGNMESIC